ncbi:Endonuclease/exonuclease/phosphatase [Trinorchestia longiramus]|nr:Endonuclease/exonuclease/phosphatase [Trinorchestia longiramus]
MNDDYSFALQSYPKCNYEQLRDFVVLPCKRKLQYITSSIDKDQMLRETFDKVQTLQQKNVFLLVDEVHIHPTVSFSVGLLSGMAENNRNRKGTSILITSTSAKQLELRLLNNCIRNNWISEKSQKISLDNETMASFADVKTQQQLSNNNQPKHIKIIAKHSNSYLKTKNRFNALKDEMENNINFTEEQTTQISNEHNPQHIQSHTQPAGISPNFLNGRYLSAEVSVKGYILNNVDKPSHSNRGGGFLIYVKEKLQPQIKTKRTTEKSEIIHLNIQLHPGQTIKIVLVYRNPTCTAIEDDEFYDCLDNIHSTPNETLIMGYFNLPHINWTTRQRQAPG